MRTIIIGDVHGCLDELLKLVETVGYGPGDRLVSLGDLLDRGPDPWGCVDLLRQIGAQVVLGNHEHKALRWFKHQRNHRLTGKVNPMKVSPARAAEWEAVSPENEAWLLSWPTVLHLSCNFVAVHGGLFPGVPLELQDVDKVIRLRLLTPEGKFVAFGQHVEGSVPWFNQWDGEQNVVVGHEVHSLEQPHVARLSGGREVWSIDTGCVFGGHLTALILNTEQPESREVVQVKAKRAYASLREHTSE